MKTAVRSTRGQSATSISSRALVALWREKASVHARVHARGRHGGLRRSRTARSSPTFSADPRFETAAILVRAGKLEPRRWSGCRRPEGSDRAMAAMQAGVLTRREWRWGEKIRAIEVLSDLLTWSDGRLLAAPAPRSLAGEFRLPIPRLVLELFLRSRDRALVDHQLGNADAPLARCEDFDEEFSTFGLTADAGSVVAPDRRPARRPGEIAPRLRPTPSRSRNCWPRSSRSVWCGPSRKRRCRRPPSRFGEPLERADRPNEPIERRVRAVDREGPGRATPIGRCDCASSTGPSPREPGAELPETGRGARSLGAADDFRDARARLGLRREPIWSRFRRGAGTRWRPEPRPIPSSSASRSLPPNARGAPGGSMLARRSLAFLARSPRRPSVCSAAAARRAGSPPRRRWRPTDDRGRRRRRPAEAPGRRSRLPQRRRRGPGRRETPPSRKRRRAGAQPAADETRRRRATGRRAGSTAGSRGAAAARRRGAPQPRAAPAGRSARAGSHRRGAATEASRPEPGTRFAVQLLLACEISTLEMRGSTTSRPARCGC